jgi:O-antigen/teichoic acid export membrane protein
MLSGRAATGLLSLGTLTLSARTLGVEAFGVLVLVQTYGQVTATLATLQSPQAVIRYGATALEKNDRAAFQSLLKFSTLWDLGGGLLGSLIGFMAAPIVGPHMGWSPEVIGYAQLYSFLVLFTACVTPTGMLRLLDRFDVLAGQTVVTPLFRLIGIATAALLGAPFWGYLLAWFVAQFLGGISLTYLAWRELARSGHLKAMSLNLRGLTAPHPGILRFMIESNLYSAILILTNQASIFLIGYFAGPSAAGVYKVGRDVSTVLTKPAELLNQSIYPEFARLSSKGSWHDFARLIMRGSVIAAGAGAFMIALTTLGGVPFLTAFFGQDYTAAYLPLILLVTAAGFTLAGFPLDAALFALGKAGIPLRISTTVVVAVQLPLLVILTRLYGPVGAAISTITAAAVTAATMGAFTLRQLRKQQTAAA